MKAEKQIKKQSCARFFGYACLFAVAAVLSTTSQYAESDNHPTDIERIMKNKKIVVAILGKEQRPFFYRDENRILKGFDIQLANKLAMFLNVEVEFNEEAESFDGLVQVVAERRADVVISKLSQTLERAKKIRYSRPYLVLRQALMVNRLKLAEHVRDEKKINSFIRNLKGNLGVISNSSYVDYAKKFFPNAALKEYPNWKTAVNAVFTGEILAAYRDELEIKKLLRTRADATLRIKTILLKDTEDKICMATHWKDQHLVYWINLFLDSLKYNYDADSLLDEYASLFLG